MEARAWWRVAPVVAALAWGGNHFSVLLLLYREREGYSQVAVDLLLATYILGIVPGFLASGPLSDRFGRRPVLVAGVLLGCTGSIVLAAGAGSLAVLAVGRLISGLSVAAAMVVGSSWIRELSSPPYGSVPGHAAARRAALTLTVGFGAGPAVSGPLAEWGPAPTLLPYVVHVALVVATALPMLTAPDARAAGRAEPRAAAAARTPVLRAIAPAAPWVFGFPGVAFAVIPAVLAPVVGGAAVVYATLLAVVALVVGALVQPFAPRIGAATRGRQLLAGLAIGAVGILLAALAAALLSPAVGVLAAAALGAGYGICIVSGLAAVQHAADPAALGLLTAVYYSLTYLGFVLPAVVAALGAIVPVAVLLVLLAAVCLACLAVSGRIAARAAR